MALCNGGSPHARPHRPQRPRSTSPTLEQGKFVGAKPPLRPKHVWSIRAKLQMSGRTRDLAMFNLAIDSKLRGCDVVSLKVEDVAPHGHAVERATVRQKKTGQPVRFEMTEQTREAVDNYIAAANKRPGQFLFGGRCGQNLSITTRQYSRLVGQWIASIGSTRASLARIHCAGPKRP
jgi:integrase